MTTPQQYMDAIRKADAAGDIPSAKRLAEMYKAEYPTPVDQGHLERAAAFGAQNEALQLPKASIMERVGRGGEDIIRGAQQIYQHTAGTVDPQLERNLTSDYRLYEKANPGFDLPRVVGQAAMLAPASLIPGGQGAVARTAIGAAVGGGAGGLAFTPTDQQSYGTGKALQVGFGAAVGGIMGFAQPYIAQLGGWLGGKAKMVWNRLQPGKQAEIITKLAEETQAAGVPWESLSVDTQGSMVNQAMSQIDNNVPLDPAAIVRKARLEKAGLAPTTAQVTRDPIAWQAERNLATQQGTGDPLRNTFVRQNQILNQQGQTLAGQIGPEVPISDVGLGVRKVAQNVSETSQQAVRASYEGALAKGGAEEIANPQGLTDGLTQVYNDFADVIPGPVKSRLLALTDEKLAPRVDNVYEALKLVNARRGVGDKATQTALGQVAKVLNDALDETAQAGGPAAQQLRNASALAAKRFGLIRGTGKEGYDLMEGLVGGDRADRVVNNLMTGNVDELAGARRFLTQFDQADFPNVPKEAATQAWNNIRAAVLRQINAKAGVGEADAARVSGTAWKKAWDALGASRQRILFSDEERTAIETVIQNAVDITREPFMSAVNYSNTGSALINYLSQKLGDIPGMGGMAGMIQKLTQHAVKQAQVRSEQQAVEQALAGAVAIPRLAPLNQLSAFPPAAAASAANVGVNVLNQPRRPPDQNALRR